MADCTLEIPLMGPMALRTPYHPDLVAELKELPRETREWDDDRRAWMIEPERREDVEKVVLRYFTALHVTDRGSSEDYIVDRVGRAAQTRLL